MTCCPHQVDFAYPSGSRNDRTDVLLAGHYRSLRLWREPVDNNIEWLITDKNTSPLAIGPPSVPPYPSCLENFAKLRKFRSLDSRGFVLVNGLACTAECQNIDLRVSHDDFVRIFDEALA